jgi:RNA polymerase primary sigma factor
VRQIEAKAVRKLQHPVRSRQLEGFLDGWGKK